MEQVQLLLPGLVHLEHILEIIISMLKLPTEQTTSNADLYSPVIDLGATPINGLKLKFYYHMYGGDMGDLFVQFDNGLVGLLLIASWDNNKRVLLHHGN